MPRVDVETLGAEEFAAALGRIDELGTLDIYVGIRANAGARAKRIRERDGSFSDDSDVDLVDVAAANEFGAPGVPERSYLRAGLDANADAITKRSETEMGPYVLGQYSLGRQAARVGMDMVGMIQEYMDDLDTPPNSEITIAEKGSDNPLIDTGQLRQSIDYEARVRGQIIQAGS